MHGSWHETLASETSPDGGSDRNFGQVMAAAFALLAVLKLRSGNAALAAVFGGAAAVMLSAALLRPALLAPLNALWFRLGMLLGRIVSPVVMALLFWLLVTPIALIMRIAGQRPLALELDPQAASYWIPRSAGAPGSMRKQS